MTEHEQNVAGLKEQVASLTRDLNDAMVLRQSLERQLQQARFDAGEVMNYLADHSQVMMHWPRLLDLLKHLQDGTPVPSAWNTMITVTALDDPTAAPGAYVRQQRSDDEETKESGPPVSAIDLTGDTASESSRGISSKRRRSSGSQGSVSKRPKHRTRSRSFRPIGTRLLVKAVVRRQTHCCFRKREHVHSWRTFRSLGMIFGWTSKCSCVTACSTQVPWSGLGRIE